MSFDTDMSGLGVPELAVFVYGTLKPGGRYHRRYCKSYLSEAVPAQVKGRLYDFPRLGYPAITAGDDWVKGYLLLFRQSAAVCEDILRRLDELEGYLENVLEQDSELDSDYQRCWVPLYDLACQPLRNAWIYCMTAQRVEQQGGVYVPGGEWPVTSRRTSFSQ